MTDSWAIDDSRFPEGAGRYAFVKNSANQAAGKSLYMVDNTVANDRLDGTFIRMASPGTIALLADNIFYGPGAIAAGSGSLVQTMNLVFTGSGLIDRGGYGARQGQWLLACDSMPSRRSRPTQADKPVHRIRLRERRSCARVNED